MPALKNAVHVANGPSCHTHVLREPFYFYFIFFLQAKQLWLDVGTLNISLCFSR